MVIYGVALLSICLLTGLILGDLLGVAIGVQANVGGVGIAMLLLVSLSNLSGQKFRLGPLTENGVTFWSAMYIPIVIAMAAKQNVVAAVSSGWLAVAAGLAAVTVSLRWFQCCLAWAGMMIEILTAVLSKNSLITAFAFVGLLAWISYWISDRLTFGHIHGSAIAILLGLVLAYAGGVATGGSKGLADFEILAGVGILGGAMFRDFAIVATAFGADLDAIKKAGAIAGLSVVIGVVLSFTVGAIVAVAFGYDDPVAITTIGAGAATYIVGPVTGSALGAASDVIALSIAAGLIKSMVVMVGTPFVAPHIGLDNPRSAMVYGGLMGTTSGVAGGLASTDPKLVPYGAMTATFYTGAGCLLAPSVLFLVVRALG